MQAEDGEAEATLLSRVSLNDPTLTHLDLEEITRICPPARVDKFIHALRENTMITSICVQEHLAFYEHSPAFCALRCAMFAPKNLEAIYLSASNTSVRDIAVWLKLTRKLKKLEIRGRVYFFADERDAAFAEALQQHPSLEEIAIDSLFFGRRWGDDEILGNTMAANRAETCAVARAVSTIPNLRSFKICGLLVGAKTFVKLVEKPTLRELELRDSGLSDEHILPMVETLLKKNGHLERLDLCGGPHATGNVLRSEFSQVGWEALFRLADRDPQIKISATAFYGDQDDFVGTVCLDDAESVQRHLDRLEIPRLLRLQEAGFDTLVPESSSGAAWIDVMDKVSDDVKALFRVIQAHPSICKSDPLRSKKRKANTALSF